MAIRLLENGENEIGLDDLNSYYDINLKESRLKEITAVSEKSSGKWKFYKSSLENESSLNDIFNTYDIYIKNKYEIDINYKALEVVKNSVVN